jgi:hypothetical protein
MLWIRGGKSRYRRIAARQLNITSGEIEACSQWKILQTMIGLLPRNFVDWQRRMDGAGLDRSLRASIQSLSVAPGAALQ